MARAEVHTCDRCNEVITRGRTQVVLHGAPPGVKAQFDLCPTCAEAMGVFVATEPKAEVVATASGPLGVKAPALAPVATTTPP